MSKLSAQLNDYISLAVMLLMFVALLGGQSRAADYTQHDSTSVDPVLLLDAHVGDQALRIGIAIASELSHFRGEDE